MLLLVALALGQLQGFALSQDGGPEKYVRHLSCGTGLTCTSSSTYGHISASGGSGAPSTAQYWTGAADGTLSAEKNLGALSTGLVVNTAGVPTAYAGSACGANNFATSTNASGALTCDVPPGTCSGGNANEVQYGNAGSCGGISNVETNGTHLSIVQVTTAPATPASNALHYDFSMDAGWPSMPFTLDAVTGIPRIEGQMWGFQGGRSGQSWRLSCSYPEGGGATTVFNIGTRAVQIGNSTAGIAWANTNITTRQRGIKATSASSVGVHAAIDTTSSNQVENLWRGNAAGAGGFLVWMRFAMTDTKALSRHFYGIKNQLAFIGNVDPISETDTAYVGCNQLDTYLSACSNDNTNLATCAAIASDDGGTFPCNTDGAAYDLWMWAPPNGDAIGWYLERWDSNNGWASGFLSSDLPRNTVGLHAALGAGTGDAGTTAMVIGFYGVCELANL